MAAEVPDDALVIRGGDPHEPERFKTMIEQAQLAHSRGLGYSLSTYAGNDHTLGRDGLIAQIATVGPIPNRMLAVTTAHQLREINCELVPSGPLPCHVRVVLGRNPDPERVKDFVGVFGQAEMNPVYQRTRRRS